MRVHADREGGGGEKSSVVVEVVVVVLVGVVVVVDDDDELSMSHFKLTNHIGPAFNTIWIMLYNCARSAENNTCTQTHVKQTLHLHERHATTEQWVQKTQWQMAKVSINANHKHIFFRFHHLKKIICMFCGFMTTAVYSSRQTTTLDSTTATTHLVLLLLRRLLLLLQITQIMTAVWPLLCTKRPLRPPLHNHLHSSKAMWEMCFAQGHTAETGMGRGLNHQLNCY